MSLRPDQSIAKAVQTLKANSSREWGLLSNTSPPLWAKGYLAQSVGDVRLDAVLMMNEGQEFVGKSSPQVLIEGGIDELWQASAYAGTCGRYSTGLLQKFLAAER